MSCASPCSDALVIFGSAAVLYMALIVYWSGRIDPKCRCPQKTKCSHRKAK